MALEDIIQNEVQCCECSKPIPSIPAWLASATVKFQCEECRHKHPRVPGMMEVDRGRAVPDVDELGDLAEIGDDSADDEAEDDATDENAEFGE